MREQMPSALRRFLTHSEPLGPSDHDATRMDDDRISEYLLDEGVATFRQAQTKSYLILLGRKGAGKSALMADIRLHKLKKGPIRVTSEAIPPKGFTYVLPLTSWQHFHSIVREVFEYARSRNEYLDLIPPEYVSELWWEVLWHQVILYFYDFSAFEEAEDVLSPVRSYVNGSPPRSVSSREDASKLAGRLFSEAREAVLTYLEERESDFCFLFDSMENFPVRNLTFEHMLSGMFSALSRLNAVSERVHVTFCLPEEVEGFLNRTAVAGQSPNLLKDFSSSFRIGWKPIDLLRVAAHRFRCAMQLHDSELYEELSEHDLSRRAGVRAVFERILPRTVHNDSGQDENTLAYILRHTQMLPRHILHVFNTILARNFENSGGFRRVSEDAIITGVSHTQRFIYEQVFHLYKQMYPRLIRACHEVLPDLTRVFTYAEMDRVNGRFKQRIEDDVESVWHVLYDIGVIGRVVTAEEQGTTAAYCYGQFHFNSDMAFARATGSEYCFHPVFCQAFGVLPRQGDPRAVYPSKLDLRDLI